MLLYSSNYYTTPQGRYQGGRKTMATPWPKHKDKLRYVTCNYCTLQTTKTKTKQKQLIDDKPYEKGLGGWVLTH